MFESINFTFAPAILLNNVQQAEGGTESLVFTPYYIDMVSADFTDSLFLLPVLPSSVRTSGWITGG